MTAAAPPRGLPESVPDFAGMIRFALVDEYARALAAEIFARVIAMRNPLAIDHGKHVLRPSSFGRCSLEFLADHLGKLDLARTDDSRAIMDNGTLMGAWFACLLEAAAIAVEAPFEVRCEVSTTYRDVPGNIDALISWKATGAHEIVEFKTTPGAGAIKPPDVRNLKQCLQGAAYGLDPNFAAERFTLVTFGYNVGRDKTGEPHDKLVQHTYATAEWKPLVDAEIHRLTELSTREDLTTDLADARDAYLCTTCRFSPCPRNRNPQRFAL